MAHGTYTLSVFGKCPQNDLEDDAKFYIQRRRMAIRMADLRNYFISNYQESPVADKEITRKLDEASIGHQAKYPGSKELGKLLTSRIRARRLLQQQFNALADKWERDTSLLSSPTRKSMHPAYRRIIAMKKPDIVELILRRMKRQGGHWFWALSELTGIDPIPTEARGRIDAMREAWIEWGSKRGYC
jgi:hypothetical protein